MSELRRLTSDDWLLWRELRLQALAEAPDAFGSKLADWQGAGDVESRWRRRLDEVALNLIASVDGKALGMASGVQPVDRVVELISLWVSPSLRGRGIADSLIGYIVDWSDSQGARQVMLRVYEHNAAAIAAYQRNGFVFTGAIEAEADGGNVERVMIRSLRG